MGLIPFQKPSHAALLIICLALGACSPYIYKDEVATFGQGVDASVQAFQSLMPPVHGLGDQEARQEALERIQEQPGEALHL